MMSLNRACGLLLELIIVNMRQILLPGIAAAGIALSFGLAACGGGGSSGGSSGGGGTDEKYVASVCSALLNFNKDLEKLGKNNAAATAAEAAKLIVKPLETYVNAIKKANPPADAKDYHNTVVKATEAALKSIKDNKNLDALGDIESREAPASLRDRLNAIATKNKDCQEADFSFN